MKKNIEIDGKEYVVEFRKKGDGQFPKLYVYVNGQQWTAWNLANFKRDPDYEWKALMVLFIDHDSYLMFASTAKVAKIDFNAGKAVLRKDRVLSLIHI